MRIGLISDVHGNSLALDLCLSRLGAFDVEAIYFLGDAVGYLPGALEVLARLEQEGIHCQQGNHEAMMLSPSAEALDREPIYRLQEARSRLDVTLLARIASWPQSREIELDGRRLLLVHGAPDSFLDGYVYPDMDLSRYKDLSCDAVLMGHTHRPFVRRIGTKLFANVGSVGLPRDQGNRATFAVYDGSDNSCRIFRVSLNVPRLLAHYGSAIHESVIACLTRSAQTFVDEPVL